MSVKPPSPRSTEPAAEATPHGVSRRRLLRAGAAASPVLLTLHSGPVSATSSCVKASGFVSAATFKSRNPGTNEIQCTSSGLSYWRTECANGSSSSYKSTLDMTVGAYLYGSSPPSNTFNTQQVRAVISSTSPSDNRTLVLQRVLAMCLSIQYKGVPTINGFSKSYLVSVWEDVLADSLYNPSGSGMSWSTLTTANWLDRLMTPNLPL